MRTRLVAPLLLVFCIFAFPLFLIGDKLTLKAGTQVEGIIQKVAQGTVTMQLGAETKTFNILDIDTIDFDTPHLQTGTSRLPLEHFLSSMEAQEMVTHIQNVEKAAAEVRKLIADTKKEWAGTTSVAANDTARWEAAKERFRAPVSRYQEVLNDFYFHVLGKVDEYNTLMKDANKIYIGVKGPFNVGSSLVPREKEKLPLKKYVPSNWYDTIFYEGYNLGYNEAYEKYGNSFHRSYEPPSTPVPGKD
jgi:hypothetical protein